MITPKENLSLICEQLRSDGKSIVFTNGCFDILHTGHTRYLAEARNLGDVLIIGLNDDQSVKRQGKGPERPVNNQSDRGELLTALRSVDYVCLFSEDTPLNLIESLKPDILVKGGDYRPDDIVGSDFVKSRGGRVEVISYVEGKSTSGIINKLRK